MNSVKTNSLYTQMDNRVSVAAVRDEIRLHCVHLTWLEEASSTSRAPDDDTRLICWPFLNRTAQWVDIPIRDWDSSHSLRYALARACVLLFKFWVLCGV